MRLTEKHLREEVLNRCIEFLDVMINSILYIEQIYSTDLFEKRLKYNLIVYECQDVDVQQYIFDFLQQTKTLFRQNSIDEIALVISTENDEKNFRRYLFEFHPIVDPSSTNTTHRDGNHFLVELDSIFAACLTELMRQRDSMKEIDDEQIQWKLQMRLARQRERNDRIELDDETFFEQMKIVDQQSMPIKRIKSFHCQRLNFQMMCQEKLNDEFILK